jgi:hypothetical protein
MKTLDALVAVSERGGSVAGRAEWRTLARAAGLGHRAMNSCYGTRTPSMVRQADDQRVLTEYGRRRDRSRRFDCDAAPPVSKWCRRRMRLLLPPSRVARPRDCGRRGSRR